MSDWRFHVVDVGPGTVTYRRWKGTAQGTVAIATLHAILADVLDKARARKSGWPDDADDTTFNVKVAAGFWNDHGRFTNAVIAGVAREAFNWFDGVLPDYGILENDTTSNVNSKPSTVPNAKVRPHRGAASIGVTYVRADESALVAEREPFTTDPDLVERGTRSHARLQNQLADDVESMGHIPLSPYGDDPPFDLLWREGEELHVAEIKSTTPTNEEHQLRLGLGQLLRYRHTLAADGTTVHATLYVEHRPRDPQWEELCQALNVTLRWPVS